jgi:hypothetical protein
MLSQRLFFRDVLANPSALKFVLNALAVGEGDGGRDLALVADRCDVPELRERIRRHFSDEVRHGEIYRDVLRRLGEETSPLPEELDYEAAIRRAGIGLSPERLREPRPLDGSEYVALFACMRVTEERAWSNTRMLHDGFSSDPTLRDCTEQVLHDETWHRAYATKEIARLASNGRQAEVRRMLRTYRRKEAWAYLSVTLPYIDRICDLLRYGFGRRFLMKVGCVGAYLWTMITPAPR